MQCHTMSIMVVWREYVCLTSPCGAGSTTLRRRTSAPWNRSGALCSDLLAVGCDTGSERRDFGGRKEGGKGLGRRKYQIG